MVVAQVACPYDARSVNRVAQCMYCVWQVTKRMFIHVSLIIKSYCLLDKKQYLY